MRKWRKLSVYIDDNWQEFKRTSQNKTLLLIQATCFLYLVTDFIPVQAQCQDHCLSQAQPIFLSQAQPQSQSQGPQFPSAVMPISSSQFQYPPQPTASPQPQAQSPSQSTSPSLSQNTSVPQIATDRPTVTPSPMVVPINYIQAENGLALRKQPTWFEFNVPQTLVRLGVLPRTELRLTVPNYFLNSGAISGTADMSIGLKEQLGPLFRRFQLALIPGFTIPTGSRSMTSNAVDPFLQIVASYKLSNNWTFASAQSIFQQTVEEEVQAENIVLHRKQLIYQPTSLLSRKLGPRADAFVEYAGNFTRRQLSDQIMDIGTVYRFRSNQQVDIRFGAGLTKVSPNIFIEFGYSLRAGKLLR